MGTRIPNRSNFPNSAKREQTGNKKKKRRERTDQRRRKRKTRDERKKAKDNKYNTRKKKSSIHRGRQNKQNKRITPRNNKTTLGERKNKEKEKTKHQKTTPNPDKTRIQAEISPRESQKQANQLVFHDPDEEQMTTSDKEGEKQGGRPPPEYDPQTNIYTYGMDRYPEGECKTNSYYMLRARPDKNEEEILRYHEREEEY